MANTHLDTQLIEELYHHVCTNEEYRTTYNINGKELTKYIAKVFQTSTTREAINIGEKLLYEGYIIHPDGSGFSDSAFDIYQFHPDLFDPPTAPTPDPEMENSSSPALQEAYDFLRKYKNYNESETSKFRRGVSKNGFSKQRSPNLQIAIPTQEPISVTKTNYHDSPIRPSPSRKKFNSLVAKLKKSTRDQRSLEELTEFIEDTLLELSTTRSNGKRMKMRVVHLEDEVATLKEDHQHLTNIIGTGSPVQKLSKNEDQEGLIASLRQQIEKLEEQNKLQLQHHEDELYTLQEEYETQLHFYQHEKKESNTQQTSPDRELFIDNTNEIRNLKHQLLKVEKDFRTYHEDSFGTIQRLKQKYHKLSHQYKNLAVKYGEQSREDSPEVPFSPLHLNQMENVAEKYDDFFKTTMDDIDAIEPEKESAFLQHILSVIDEQERSMVSPTPSEASIESPKPKKKIRSPNNTNGRPITPRKQRVKEMVHRRLQEQQRQAANDREHRLRQIYKSKLKTNLPPRLRV